jgi:predicted GIY-YIG superfamily endonuclease
MGNFFYVYILESQNDPQRHYTGFTEDLRSRLVHHNRGESVHTAKYAPWNLKTYFAFSDRQTALNFERYLKTRSGRAFSKKRL